ncbi:MAG: hypothetical protein D6767_07050 [Candidatus Hydrogenedentota bacterium]|nr:MAG: hypothetical protein D6767_07050 [Candidatus Hydrogenedentota bacterium]
MLKVKSKKTWILLALLPLLAFAYGIYYSKVSRSQSKAEELFYKGHLLYNTYKYRAAADFFTQSLSYNPEFFLARRMLGYALYFAGLPEEAANEWQIILDNGGYDPPLKFHLQKMRSFIVPRSEKYVYRESLRSKTGYRFSWPVFLTELPNHHLILLSLNSTDPEKPDGNLIELDANGNFFRNLRRISGRLHSPMGAAFNNNTLWISDYAEDKIHRFAYHHDLLKILTDPLPPIPSDVPKNQKIKFRGPVGLCFLQGYLYVADSGNNRIVKLDKDGTFISEFSHTVEEETLHEPFGLACSENYGIFVSLPYESRLARFDEYGNFLGYVENDHLSKPRHIQFSANQSKLLIADEENGILFYDLNHNQWRMLQEFETSDGKVISFLRAYSAVEDFFGNLYVADYAAHTIYRFTPERYLYANLEPWIERIDASNFPTVAVWASVKDYKGNYLTDLSGDYFRIQENDAEVGRLSGSYLKQFENQSSWILLLDRTKSMQEFLSSLEWTLDFIITDIRIKDKIKLMSYTNEFREDTQWIRSRLKLQQALKAHLDSDYQSNQTDGLLPALQAAVSKLLPQQGKRAIIWITAGATFPENTIRVTQLARYARVNHIPIFIISYEKQVAADSEQNQSDMKEKFKALAKSTGGKYYPAFREHLTKILSDLRSVPEERIVLLYKSVADPNWKKQYMEIRLDVKFRGSQGYETGGYFIP